MFCAAFCRFVWSQCCISGVAPLKYFLGSKSSTFGAETLRWSFGFHSCPFARAAAQFYVCSNMPPRGKAKAKKEVEENGKERQVRQSRNVKAASYKDLSDSEDDKPIRKRSKKESESESMSEEEKPKVRGKKGRRAPARSRKVDVSDSDEASDFVSSDESSAEESRKRKKGGRKPTRSLRTNQNTSYKDLSDSEEESVEEDEDSTSEKEEKSPPKRGKGRPAGKKSKKEESSEGEEEEEEEEEDVEDEAEESEEDEKEDSKSDKPKSKPKSATPDSSTDDNAKDKSDSKEAEKKDKDDKPRPEHELSDEEEEEEEEGDDDEEDGKDSKEKSSKKAKTDEKKLTKKGKDEEKDSKKRSRADKNGEAATGDAKDSEPQAKKAKVEAKPLLNKTDTDYASIEFTSSAKTKDGNLWNLKISSWNVAGLRAWIKKNGLEYIKHEKPDILCLQETKCSEQKLPPEAKFDGYETYWLSGENEGQAGVAVLSKTKPIEVKYGIDKPEFDADGRVITAEYEKFYLVNTYVPNAGNGLKTLPRRLEWDPLFRAYLKKLDEKKPVILCGDLNVAHLEIDLANPKTNQKTAGFTPQERDGMTELLKEGFVDTFRSMYPDKKSAYSFWSYFSNARSRNIGWRLDYFITSERFLPNICDNVMRNEVFGSDHCPITLFAHV